MTEASGVPTHLHRGGPPETALDPEPEDLRAALDAAADRADPEERRAALAATVARHPASSAAWAALGEAARDPVEAYACFRVGYHRGLDRLRRSGWRGSGYVRWQHPGNRGFLRSLDGLRAAAAAIGETDEVHRCEDFLRQLDPSWPPPGYEPVRIPSG